MTMPFPLPGEAALLTSAEPLPDLCMTCHAPLPVGGAPVFCGLACEMADYEDFQRELETLACQRDRERVGMPSREE